MPFPKLLLVSLVLCFWHPHAGAYTMHGTVSHVVDGDTVVVTDAHQKHHLFHLLGADAPEKRQSFYREAKQAFKERYMNKPVVVEWLREEVCPRHGGSACAQLARILAKGEDIALHQISRGFAWHDKRHLREQSTADRALYSDAQHIAQQHGRGLWKNPGAVPPWVFVPPKNNTRRTAPKR